jgi:hypothetical protein
MLERRLKQLEDNPSVAFSIFVFIIVMLSDDGMLIIVVAAVVFVIAETDIDLDDVEVISRSRRLLLIVFKY